MMFARPDFFTRWILLMTLTLIVLLAACGVDGDKVETVDDAVKLIQDVDRDGTWGYFYDGLDALAEQENYSVIMHTRQFETDAEGNPTDAPVRTQTMTFTNIQGQIVRLRIETDAEVTELVSLARNTEELPQVYKVVDDSFVCPTQEDLMVLTSVEMKAFTLAAIGLFSKESLSVAEFDENVTILDRDAEHYIFESRFADALDILARTDNAELLERIERPQVDDMHGTFDLDVETDAMLRFEVTFSDNKQSQMVEYDFEVTQWGDVPDIMIEGDLPTCD